MRWLSVRLQLAGKSVAIFYNFCWENSVFVYHSIPVCRYANAILFIPIFKFEGAQLS